MDYGKAPEDPSPLLNGLKKTERSLDSTSMENPIFLKVGNLSRPNPARVNSLPRFARHKWTMWIGPCKVPERHRQNGKELVAPPGKFLYAIARLVRKHSPLRGYRNIGQWKPIRESRDIDIPWLPGISISCRSRSVDGKRDARSSGTRCRRTSHSLEFPLLMMAWKIAPALAMGTPW